MIMLHQPYLEIVLSFCTSACLACIVPSRSDDSMQSLIVITLVITVIESYTQPGASTDRWPYGLSLGCLCLPWLLYRFSSFLWLVSIFTALLCLCIVQLPKRWIDGVGTVALLLYCSIWTALYLVRPDGEQGVILLWMLRSIGVLALLVGRMFKNFSPGEMILCSQLLAVLFGEADFPAASLSTDRLTREMWKLTATSVAWLVAECVTIRHWTIPVPAGTNQQQYLRVSFLSAAIVSSYLSFRLLSMTPIVVDIAGFLVASSLKRWIVIYWTISVGMGILIAKGLQGRLPNIVLRKWFHFLALIIILPGYILHPIHLRISLACAFVIFCLAEAVRLANVPIISSKIDGFLARFTDDRDRGPVIFSHFSLLLGFAIPIWIAPCLEGDDVEVHLLSLSGVVGLGIGDAFAAIVGSSVGRLRIFGGEKSLEGALACFVSCMMGWMGMGCVLPIPIERLIVPTLAATIFEATSAQNDNLFLPLYYFAMIAASGGQ